MVCGAIVLFLLWFFIFKVKHLKVPSVYLITGGVKTGKSFVSVWLAVKYYKRARRKARVCNFFIKFLINPIIWWRRFAHESKRNYFKLKDMPMLYSNMRLRNIKYNLLSLDIILREVKIPVGSVVLIDEISLFADSTLCLTKQYKEKNLHESLMLFVKLFGHYCGGHLIVNTQALCDCAHEFKRCISNYLWIEVNKRYPFFSLLKVRELAHSEDNDIVNNFSQDSELDTRPLFVLNKYRKYYDYRCYSIFTDGLEMKVNYDNPVLDKHDSLKTEVLLTLQDFKTLKAFQQKYESEVKDNEKA